MPNFPFDMCRVKATVLRACLVWWYNVEFLLPVSSVIFGASYADFMGSEWEREWLSLLSSLYPCVWISSKKMKKPLSFASFRSLLLSVMSLRYLYSLYLGLWYGAGLQDICTLFCYCYLVLKGVVQRMTAWLLLFWGNVCSLSVVDEPSYWVCFMQKIQ